MLELLELLMRGLGQACRVATFAVIRSNISTCKPAPAYNTSLLILSGYAGRAREVEDIIVKEGKE